MILYRSAFASSAAEPSLSLGVNELLRVSDRIVGGLAFHVLFFRPADLYSHFDGTGATRVPRWLSATQTWLSEGVMDDGMAEFSAIGSSKEGGYLTAFITYPAQQGNMRRHWSQYRFMPAGSGLARVLSRSWCAQNGNQGRRQDPGDTWTVDTNKWAK